MSDRSDARDRLLDAGMSEEMAEAVLQSGSSIQSILDWDDSFIQAMAAAAPAPSKTLYDQRMTEFGFDTSSETPPAGLGQGAFSYVAPTKGYQTDPTTGVIRFNNGVIVNPENDEVLFPPGDADVPGSRAWLNKIQKKWGPDQVEKWRKKLYNWGYIESPQGGKDVQFIEGLREYHKYRYRNGGKAVPFSSTSAAPTLEETYDDVFIEQEIRETFSGDMTYEPTDDELARFKQIYKKAARRGLKKGKTPEAAIARGQAAFAEAYTEDPAIKTITEDNEERGEVADAFLNAFQAIDMLA